jgi:iron-sulfur cluster repair protein YtfE (RIC family)
MKTLTQPLREEHKELLPHIEAILRVAEQIGERSVAEIRSAVDEVYDFLAYHLKPHAEAEEAALYPAVQRALGNPDATKTMSRDHVEVGRYIEELSTLRAGLTVPTLTDAHVKDLRRVLYGVYALVHVHFAKEEEVYLPILDAWLTPESAQEMFEAMEAAAHAAKHAAHA